MHVKITTRLKTIYLSPPISSLLVLRHNHPSSRYVGQDRLGQKIWEGGLLRRLRPAYEGGKEAGKIVGNVAFMVITAEAGGAVAKSVATIARELDALGISETGSVGKNITIDALHNIQDALGGAASQEAVDHIFMQLAGTDKMPNPIEVPGKNTGISGVTPIRYTIKLSNGDHVTLRNYARSVGDSGPVWTIQVPTNMKNSLGKEIKFKR